jgi:hypothetical protein
VTVVVKMSFKQWADYMSDLGERFEPAVMRGVRAGALRCIPRLQQRTSHAPPASPGGTSGALDTGLYKAAWKTGSLPNGASVFNDRPYAGVIDYGRRPAPVSRGGVRNLEAWAKRKLKLGQAQARAAAWAIAKKLEKRPLLARKVLSGDLDGLVKLVEEEILHELDVELGR